MSRKEAGRGFVIIEDNVDASVRRLEDNIKKSKEKLIVAARNSTDTRMIDRTTRKQKWEEKQVISREISQEKTWALLRKGNCTREPNWWVGWI